MSIHNLFLPHKETHKKARLISWEALLVYLLLFVILQSSFSLLGQLKPGILGTTSSITRERIIELTNFERAKNGLPPLAENDSLDRAATAKAANMFEENYWAHFSPSGKDPWGFILSSGYKFSVAGENLAKNFTNSEDVVVAWMNSPSHKENIINSKYKEIGIAVEDGVLNGEGTTLVVQMFGTPTALASAPTTPNITTFANNSTSAPTTNPQAVAQAAPLATPQNEPIVNVGGEKIKVAPEEYEASQKIALVNAPISPAIKGEPLFDPFTVSKVVGLSLVGLISLLLILDFMVLRARGVFRLSSHHLAHLSLILVAAIGLLIITRGNIL